MAALSASQVIDIVAAAHPPFKLRSTPVHGNGAVPPLQIPDRPLPRSHDYPRPLRIAATRNPFGCPAWRHSAAVNVPPAAGSSDGHARRRYY